MIKYRTYFDKNNTIIRNQYTNTGRNQVSELFYGGSLSTGTTKYSRFLFHFDLTEVIAKYNDKTFADTSKLTHKVKLFNTSQFSVKTDAEERGMARATSFDLILFLIPESYDEGVGYDFVPIVANEATLNDTFKISPSNWYQRTANFWAEAGVYSGSPQTYSGGNIYITKQHFDKGNENFEVDISSTINDLVVSGACVANYGFGVAFDPGFEDSVTEFLNFVAFHTRHTQTFFEPHLETTYSATIKDDRNKFYLDKPNRLYLYSNLDGSPSNIYTDTPSTDACGNVISTTITKPACNVYDNDGTLFSAFTSSDVVQETKGVYYVDISIPSTTYSKHTMFNDVWSGITYGSITRPSSSLEFITRSSDEYYSVGSAESFPKDFGFSVSGIRRDEKIQPGDKRKVLVSARVPYTVNDQSELIDGLQYRLYIKQGQEDIEVIAYTDVDRTYLYNSFTIDTSWLIPNEYYIDFKLTSNEKVTTYKEQMKFQVISEMTNENL